MENCVAPGLDEFDVLLEVVLSLVRVVTDQSTLLSYVEHVQLAYSHCSWTNSDLLRGLKALSAHAFASDWQLPFLNQR